MQEAWNKKSIFIFIFYYNLDVVYFLICYNKLAVCYLHFQIWKYNHVAKKTSDGAGNMSRPVLNKPPGQPNLFGGENQARQ